MRCSHHDILGILNNVPPGFAAIRLIWKHSKSHQGTVGTKLDQIAVMQGRLPGLPIIDKQGMLASQIAEHGSMIVQG
jgi:hypothetical protein